MSDEQTPPEGTDPLTNLKAEMSRKLGNSDSRLAELEKTNQALLARLNQIIAPPVAAQAKKEELTELLYSNPDRYAELIAERANTRVNESLAKQGKVNQTLSQLTSEYPELQDPQHEMTRKAIEIYNGLSPEEQQSSLSYKMAVREAADHVGLKPRSKRPVDEEPSFGSGSGGGRSSARKKEKLSDVTEAWAELLGVDTKDAKVKARMVDRQTRDWSRFKPVK